MNLSNKNNILFCDMNAKYIDKYQWQLWIDEEKVNQIRLSYLKNMVWNHNIQNT